MNAGMLQEAVKQISNGSIVTVLQLMFKDCHNVCVFVSVSPLAHKCLLRLNNLNFSIWSYKDCSTLMTLGA